MLGFRHLQTRLTVLYAALFGVVIAIIAVALQLGLTANARREVTRELGASSQVFERVWALHAQRLQIGAQLLSQDFGFRQAVATGDPATVRSALGSLERRLGVTGAVVLRPDGGELAADGGVPIDSHALARRLDPQEPSAGMLGIDGLPILAVAAPVLAPDPQGWVVFGQRVDRKELDGLARMASIPLRAEVFTIKAAPKGAVRDLVAAALGRNAAPTVVTGTPAGPALVLARPLPALGGGARSALVLSYPLAEAMAPYHRLSMLLLAVGLLGLGLTCAGGWAVARGVTRPVQMLDEAAHRLQRGEEADLSIPGRDEIARLADSFNAMAATIREREAHILELAHRDVESGLGNRRALERRLAGLTGASSPAAVAVFGIDRFEAVRGAIGHDLAQKLVQAVAGRLTDCCGQEVARLTTSSLAFVFEAVDAAGAQAGLERLVRIMRTSIPVGGAVVDVTLTCGFAVAKPNEGAGSLIGRAAVARDQAARSFRRVAAFDARAYGDPAGDLSLMSEMLSAIGTPAFALAYQPKYDFRRGAVTGVEALARWTHPLRGPVPPDRFVTMAEETGHIREMTDWVLQQALSDQQRLLHAGHALDMSVNLSGRLLGDDGFIGTVIESARRRVGPLCLEVTETAVIEDPERAKRNVARLAEQDIALSIDDYGAGLSSLAYLRDLKAHELKIDKSFVLALDQGASYALLVRSTIDLGHSLGLKVTAEGVETGTAQALLAGMGCDLAQGYFIGRPMPLRMLGEFLAAPPAERVAEAVAKAS